MLILFLISALMLLWLYATLEAREKKNRQHNRQWFIVQHYPKRSGGIEKVHYGGYGKTLSLD